MLAGVAKGLNHDVAVFDLGSLQFSRVCSDQPTVGLHALPNATPEFFGIAPDPSERVDDTATRDVLLGVIIVVVVCLCHLFLMVVNLDVISVDNFDHLDTLAKNHGVAV